jgi:hypothetical protein
VLVPHLESGVWLPTQDFKFEYLSGGIGKKANLVKEIVKNMCMHLLGNNMKEDERCVKESHK